MRIDGTIKNILGESVKTRLLYHKWHKTGVITCLTTRKWAIIKVLVTQDLPRGRDSGNHFGIPEIASDKSRFTFI